MGIQILTSILSFIKENKLASILIVLLTIVSFKYINEYQYSSELKLEVSNLKIKNSELKIKTDLQTSTINALEASITNQNQKIDNLSAKSKELQEKAKEAISIADSKATLLQEQNEKLKRKQWTGNDCQDVKDLLDGLGE